MRSFSGSWPSIPRNSTDDSTGGRFPSTFGFPSSYFAITNHANPVTITEAATSGFNLISASCVDQKGNTVAATLASGVLTVPTASYQANQDIVCTFLNRKFPSADLVITKSNGVTSVVKGSSTTYSVVVTNNGPDPINGAIVKDTPGAGITCPSGNAVVITGSGVPAGSFTLSNLTGTGIVLGNLNSGQSATLTFSCQVN